MASADKLLPDDVTREDKSMQKLHNTKPPSASIAYVLALTNAGAEKWNDLAEYACWEGCAGAVALEKNADNSSRARP
jgi:hypothetical protein